MLRFLTLFGAKCRPHLDRKKPATLSAVARARSYDLVQADVRAARPEGVHKGRTRAQGGGHVPQRDRARLREGARSASPTSSAAWGRWRTAFAPRSTGRASAPSQTASWTSFPARPRSGRSVSEISTSPRPGHAAPWLRLPPWRRLPRASRSLSSQPRFTTSVTKAPDAYTVRQAAYDLRNFRSKHLVEKPGRPRRYHVPPEAFRTITAVTTIRDRVLAR